MLFGCRSAAPLANEHPITPLAAPTADAALTELRARRASFTGERSFMRVRAISGEQTDSFRAQLVVDARGHMRLDAFTPIGTTAMTLYADDEHAVFLNAINFTAWQGAPSELAKSFGFFGSARPNDVALLLLGIPTSNDVQYAASPSGLARADAGDVVVTYDPPVQPPKNVVVTHGNQRLEITHLDVAATDAQVDAPKIPSNYRCCVPPRL